MDRDKDKNDKKNIEYFNIDDNNDSNLIYGEEEVKDNKTIFYTEGDVEEKNDILYGQSCPIVYDDESKNIDDYQSNIIFEKNKEKNDLNEINNTDNRDITKKILNSIIVDLFKNVLTIEEKSMKLRGIKDLSMSEIHVIDAIESGDGKMMSEIADILEITMGTLTTSITKLEKKGYVLREKDIYDKRVVIAKLTRKGELIEKIHKNFHDEMIEHLIIDLKLDEDKALLKALVNINNFFVKEYGGDNVY
ncbi:MarR family winged helix-turn-helix transcriptional regulator [Peptostreptococcus equinus]|uniref:MarR family winged helix-turn-helix transcriptional regulator n=1 Tax=Peptostreptococcus equinus TaxID=3003601 RepID=A0ABY7JP90_9FIRM|nr:MarR family winged helix-turn-helix transcriptional regulator [Peptostreptococcus sp. CBA3647]WAW14296.1 MarR family winged helix-turn-helix transcriptional regulator [Peptostreptococcus sp. CBA3647]